MPSTKQKDWITTLPFNALQKLCLVHGLSGGGSGDVLRSRLQGYFKSEKFNNIKQSSGKRPAQTAASSEVESPPAKLQRKNEDGLICSITHALFLDPVTAEDGLIYERNAIEEYFEKHQGEELKSPITRELIGKKLLSSPQIKSTIETLVENGAITGSQAEDWKNRVKEKKEMECLLKKAEEGDAVAMEHVAIRHDSGSHGFKRDDKEAFKWYEKARVAGSLIGLASVGNVLVGGYSGVAQDIGKGMMYLGMAEGQGSDYAAYLLGTYLADGRRGAPIDKVEARKMLEKCLSGNCLHKNMKDKAKKDARKVLDEILIDLT